MNHVLEVSSTGTLRPLQHVSVGQPQDPIEAARHAVDLILAAAHEAGQGEAVRLLHAVTALLAAATRE